MNRITMSEGMWGVTLAAALLAPLAGALANETHAYGIANFGGPGECGSSGQKA